MFPARERRIGKLRSAIRDDADGVHRSFDGDDKLVMRLPAFVDLKFLFGIFGANQVSDLIHFGTIDVCSVKNGDSFPFGRASTLKEFKAGIFEVGR